MSLFHVKRGEGPARMPVTALRELGCSACPLSMSDAIHKDMPPSGLASAPLYILGDAPGETEDNIGKPFAGESGKLLRSVLPGDADFRVNNVVRTRPPGNRKPAAREVECCRLSVEKDIERVAPRVLLLLGATALDWILPHNAGMSVMAGREFPVKVGSHVMWCHCAMHPSEVLRVGGADTPAGRCFSRHVVNAYSRSRDAETPVIVSEDRMLEELELPDNYSDAMNALEQFVEYARKCSVVGLDIETTSDESVKSRQLRPFGKGSRILSVALSVMGKSIALPLCHEGAGMSDNQKRELEKRLYKVLRKDFAGKMIVAHNIAFDLEWLTVKLGSKLAEGDNFHCSQQAAYVLDSRGALSLDACFRQQFGMSIKAVSDIDVASLASHPLSEVLRYNALDAKACRMLFVRQMSTIKARGEEHVYSDQIRRTRSVVLMQTRTSLPADTKLLRVMNDGWDKRRRKAEKRMRKLVEVKEFEANRGRRFAPSKVGDVAAVLRSVGLHDAAEGTGKDTLDGIDHDFARLMREWRTMNKMQGTYASAFLPGGKYLWKGDVVRPTFNTTATRTRRLSSANPNGQNFPKREFEKMRDFVVAPEGHSIVSFDFTQMEVIVIAAASRDERLMSAVRDGVDIHAEWARNIAGACGSNWNGSDEQFAKQRYLAKNQFVFPNFYGSFYKPITQSLGASESVVRTLCDKFWAEFAGVKKWQLRTVKEYEERGYVKLLTGFRCPGVLSRNKIFNYPIQGTASDIVVRALCELVELAIARKLLYLIPILNIHDDLTFIIPDALLRKEVKRIRKVMQSPVYSFMKGIPLSVDVTIGKSWGSMKDYE